MIRGPAKALSQRDFVEHARACWGVLPDFVERLAEEVNAVGQKEAGKRVGYSNTVVSQVLSNTYHKGDMAKFEASVRGALMGATVDCPEQGEMGRDVCLQWQDKPFAATSSDRVRMYHACRRCPLSKFTKDPSDVA